MASSARFFAQPCEERHGPTRFCGRNWHTAARNRAGVNLPGSLAGAKAAELQLSRAPRLFTSVANLAPKITQYIRHDNEAAKPIRWSYRNPAHRISRTSAS